MNGSMAHANQPLKMPALGSPYSDHLAVVIMIFIALAPLPLGSNRPIIWGFNAMTLGAIGTLYFLFAAKSGAFRPPQRHILVPAWLWLGTLIYMAIQTLPLDGLGIGIVRHSVWGDIVITNVISLAPGSTLLAIVRWLSYGLFFVLVLQVAVNRHRANLMLQAAFFIVLAHAVLALIDLVQDGNVLSFLGTPAYPDNATGTFVSRNSFATYLVFGIGTGLALLMRQFEPGQPDEANSRPLSLHSAWLTVGLIIISGALFATQSRMGIAVGALSAVFTLMIAFTRPGGSRLLSIALISTASLLVLGALAFLLGEGVIGRMDDLYFDGAVRAALYGQVAEMIISNHPWLGYGAGSFELAYQLFHREPVSAYLIWDKAHSTYLGLWADLGVIVGTFPMLILMIFAWRAIQGLSRSNSWWISLAGLNAILAAAAHSVVDFSLEIDANIYHMLLLIGLAIARISRPQPGTPQPGTVQ
jgi:hypothetical protein